jgi:type IV secretory pathway VirD2 relaxase
LSKQAGLLEGLLQDPLWSRKGKGLGRKANQVVEYIPEVMVKITGNTKSGSHLQAHLDYIAREGKLELETENQEVISGKDAIKELQAEWMQDRGKKRKGNQRETTNIVLSMPFGTPPAAVKDAARNFAKERFSENHQYVFVLHTDGKNGNPHVHLTVKNLGYDGRRLHVKKGDPQIWREGFAKALNYQGIEALATSRAVRGVVKKAVKQTILHIRERTGLPSKTDQAKVKEIIEQSLQQDSERVKPWERKIKARQTEIRKAWLALSQEAQKRNESRLSEKILNYVKSMPPLKTERHELKEHIAESRQEQRNDADYDR